MLPEARAEVARKFRTCSTNVGLSLQLRQEAKVFELVEREAYDGTVQHRLKRDIKAFARISTDSGDVTACIHEAIPKSTGTGI